MNTQHLVTSTTYALVAAVLTVAVSMASFFLIEPTVGQAVDSTPFTIKTTITDEISFLTQPTNVTATSSINGITGGTANGSTTAVVRTNSFTGYEMFIAFANNAPDNAMLGDVSDNQSIRDYPASGGEPTFLFSTASTSAVFGYTVSAADDTDLDQSFLDDGSSCNDLGGSYTADRCWMEPSVSSFQIIDRTSAAATGATTTIHFRVYVPNNPSPALVADIYTATATLTALNQ